VEPLQAGDPERIGDYAVRGRLGRGAMGIVYLGRSPGGRLVAVKVARAELADDAGFRDRFRHEVAMARAVGGFWTAAVVDADPGARQPWLATEYVPGPTLREVVAAHGPLPEPAVRRLVAGLAEALLAIHGAGMVHRDLKPANVLLAADGPRVIDFGIAKALQNPGLTVTGMLIGTPGFLSPEQVEGRELTPASDVFALGSVLVYAATGRGPYGDGDVAALMYRVVHAAPSLSGVPPPLLPLAARCLERDPARRPTPAQVLAELGTPDAAEWLPEPVRTLVAERRTAVLDAARTPTRAYTRAAPAAAAPLRAVPLPTTPLQAAAVPASPHPAPRPIPPVPTQRGPGGQAVFVTSRLAALLWGSLFATGALTCLSFSGSTHDLGQSGTSFVFFVGFVLMAVPAVRLAFTLARPARSLEVSAAGVAFAYGRHRMALSWPQLGRVRVVEHAKRPWVVGWLADPQAVHSGLGPDFPAVHGGFRLFPVGHERRRRGREREVRELRAALAWYGRGAYDPSP
jgi:predicted Ser/Thr protein kinase